MERFISGAVDRFIAKEVILQENKKIYEFELKQGITIIFNLIIIVFIGLIFGELWNLMIFTIAYLALRSYAGGYHAETEVGCYMLSILMILVVVLISKLVELNFLLEVIGVLLATGVLWVFAPIEDYRKPLDEKETKVYKKKLRKILFVELVLLAASRTVFNDFYLMVFVSVLFVAFVVLLGVMKNNTISRNFKP